METPDLLIRYRRYLKRKNCSALTVKNYLNILSSFLAWNQVPLTTVTHIEIGLYVEHLLKTRKPSTVIWA